MAYSKSERCSLGPVLITQYLTGPLKEFVTTPGQRAKPHGVRMCELRELIVDAGGAAPTDPNAMPFLANETKTPNRNDFDPADAGKTVWYALRWINTKGDPGPWSQITSYPIL